jgi:energy-coupling factor transporter transmembrane protein EcfT
LKLHIINRFVSVILIAIMIAFVSMQKQFFIAILMILFALMITSQPFLKSIRKLKWMLLVLFLIFSFNTPGRYIYNWPVSFSPTYEGLLHGSLQAFKITAMLATLHLFLLNLPHEKLVGGLFQLAKPLRIVGFPAERFAARLGLTLQYVKELQSQENSFTSLFQALQFQDLTILPLQTQDLTVLKCQKTILIENIPFKAQDWLMLMVLLVFAAVFMAIKV